MQTWIHITNLPYKPPYIHFVFNFSLQIMRSIRRKETCTWRCSQKSTGHKHEEHNKRF